jgi:hypothetical protein
VLVVFRNLFRRFVASPTAAVRNENSHVVVYAHLDAEPLVEEQPAEPLPKSNLATWKPSPSHRARLLSMRLEHLKLCSPHRCHRLQQLGILTAGDLACASPERLANQFRAARKAQRVLKDYRRAVRFAASVPGMMPRDALLLIRIHRRSVHGLSLESPAKLHRDLERFSQSSEGQLYLRGRRIPSLRRLKLWISACQQSSNSAPVHARAA